MPGWRPTLSLLLVLLTATPPISHWWEGQMLRHMLGQFPALVLAGVLLVPLAQRRDHGDQLRGIATVLLALFCLAFWMLPRWLDAAVVDTRTDMAKIASLVLIAGLGLGWGWQRLGAVLRAFIWVQALSMMVALGILYRAFPDRLCNAYLQGEQQRLGLAFLLLSGMLGLGLASQALFSQTAAGRPSENGHRDSAQTVGVPPPPGRVDPGR